MSYQAVEWALYKAPMLLTEKGKPDTTARHVLAVLAEHANESGQNARPSVLRIRFATGLDERTVERALLRLQAGKLIEMAGRTHTGTRKWNLAVDVVRPSAEWDDMVEAAEAEREAESARRKARRHRSSCSDSGDTETHVRDSASRTPGFSVRTSGTQSTDVRDSASGIRDATPPEPPEPPVIHSANHPGTSPGGAPPPDPRRRPPPSASAFESAGSLAIALTPAQDQRGESLPHAREAAPVVEIFPGVLGEAPYRSPAPPKPRGQLPDVVLRAMANRAAAREAHQARLAQEGTETA